MPIPAFDGIHNVLPPHLGNPRDPGDHSPYPCTMVELCGRFATSAKRRTILAGFLSLRDQLFNLGLKGFQWLDGSFLEDIEAQASRNPGDIDVVTFVAEPIDLNDLAALTTSNTWLLDRDHTKANYHVDHFLVPMGSAPRILIELSRYWYGLFSHRRDGVWKGMLMVDLSNPDDDAAGKGLLGGTP